MDYLLQKPGWIAAPFLAQPPAFDEAALAALVDADGDRHAAGIAHRTGLSSALVRKILTTNADAALVALAENQAAPLQRADFEMLKAAAPALPPLQAALAKRTDLPADVAATLLWHTGATHGKQSFEHALAVTPETLSLASEAASAIGLSRGNKASHPEDAASYAVQKHSVGELKEPLLIRLLRDRDMDRFYACLDKISGRDRATAEAVVADIKALGGEAIANGSSVSDDAGVKKMIDDTMNAFGRIDIIIANAGILRDKSFSKMTTEDINLVLDVHLRGSFKPIHAAWNIMKEQNYGRIVVTTSSTGLYGNFGQANYGAGKLGVVGMMNTLKIEGAKNNIKINTICPIAATRMTEGLMSPEALAQLKPEFVTPGVMNLVKDDAPTGMILSAGAGAFSMAQIVETKGAFVGQGEALTAEAVEAKWDQITDTSVQTPFDSGAGHGANIFARLQEAAAKA